jgi:hypothetical protein
MATQADVRRIACLCIGLLASCKADGKRNTVHVPDSSTAIGAKDSTSSRVGDTPPASNCSLGREPLLTGNGIGDLRIGATAEQVHQQCDVIRDTTLQFGAEGMPERRIAVRLGRDTVEGTAVNDKVWRLEVLSPRFRTNDSLGVGSTVAKIREQTAQYLGYGEGGPFISLPKHCGLSFELDGVKGFARSWEQVPNTATVRKVLVLGCRNPSAR